MTFKPILCAAILAFSAHAGAESIISTTPSWPPEESLLQEAQATTSRSVQWLADQQHPDGHWSNPTFPALTSLALWALIDSGWNNPEQKEKAIEYILSCVHENGAIYQKPAEERKGGGLKNYNTALSMIALEKADDPALTPVILAARTWLADSQHLGGDIYRGGMGYDPATGRSYTDLSNSYIAFEAMRMTEHLEDYRPEGEEKADLDWEAAQDYVESIHNDPEFNELSWVTEDPKELGGFAYHPENTRAGTTTNEAGVVKFRSFGSMTYAGLLSYIYANVDKEDPRVISTMQWAVRHFDLTQNPGTGKEGLYYYLNVLSKGLNAYGQDLIYPLEGDPISWRESLIKELLSTYKTDKKGQVYWINDVSRYWESDPVLVSSYAMIALQYALGSAQ